MRDFRSLSFLQKSQEMLLICAKLYSWQMDSEYNLQFTNHPNGQLFYNLFKISGCGEKIRSHFRTAVNPIIVSDDLGFTWIIAAQKEADTILEYHLLGPFFTVEASEQYFMRLCHQLRISSELMEQVRSQLKQIPTVQSTAALPYAVMLQYYAVGSTIRPEEITYAVTTAAPDDAALWMANGEHNTWEAERNLFESIKTGTLDLNGTALTSSFSGGTIGTLCPGDPLRQAKDEVIVLIVLASRAAILGGVSPEGGYSIADYFFQRVEACESIGAVQSCSGELLHTILHRVNQCRQRQHNSAIVSGCMEYVETHLFEKINLDRMAKALGYATYYLSKRFKEETGTSINDYIKNEKIKQAKLLLTKTDITVNEVCERLFFSSPSYFGAVFKKCTGMLPSEYQNLSQIKKAQE